MDGNLDLASDVCLCGIAQSIEFVSGCGREILQARVYRVFRANPTMLKILDHQRLPVSPYKLTSKRVQAGSATGAKFGFAIWGPPGLLGSTGMVKLGTAFTTLLPPLCRLIRVTFSTPTTSHTSLVPLRLRATLVAYLFQGLIKKWDSISHELQLLPKYQGTLDVAYDAVCSRTIFSEERSGHARTLFSV